MIDYVIIIGCVLFIIVIIASTLLRMYFNRNKE